MEPLTVALLQGIHQKGQEDPVCHGPVSPRAGGQDKAQEWKTGQLVTAVVYRHV